MSEDSKKSGYSLKETIRELRKEILEVEIELYNEKRGEEDQIKKEEDIDYELKEFYPYELDRYIRNKEKQFERAMEIMEINTEKFKDDSGIFSFSEEQKEVIKTILLHDNFVKKKEELDKLEKEKEELKQERQKMAERVLKRNSQSKKFAVKKLENYRKESNRIEGEIKKIEEKRNEMLRELGDRHLKMLGSKKDQVLGDREGILTFLANFEAIERELLFLQKERIKLSLNQRVDEVYSKVEGGRPTRDAQKILERFEEEALAREGVDPKKLDHLCRKTVMELALSSPVLKEKAIQDMDLEELRKEIEKIKSQLGDHT